MIGVDTNVLVRLFVVDEPQSRVAALFFAERSASNPAFVSVVALAEFGWVLRRKYKLPTERIAAAVQAMLDSDDFVLEQRDVVERAVQHLVSAKIDLADLLIAQVAAMANAAPTATFDRDAAKRVPGMELLK